MSFGVFQKRFNLIAAFFACWAIQLSTGITVRNPLTVVFFVLFLWIGNRKSYRLDNIKQWVKVLGAAIGAIAFSAYFYSNVVACFENRLFQMISIFILVAGFFSMCMLILGGFTKEDSAINSKNVESLGNGNNKSLIADKFLPWINSLSQSLSQNRVKEVIVIMCICLLCWLPYYLYEFPGIMTADSMVQYMQIIGIEPVSNHHPILHTLIIALFYKIGMAVSGNPLVVIALYTAVQMIFLSFCCGVLIRHINIPWQKLLALIFFALVPFNAVFAVTVWKDIYFAGITMLLICKILNFIDMKDENRVGDYVILTLLLILFALFRSNAWYAFIVWTPFAVCFFREKLIPITVSLVVVIASVVIIKGPVMSAFGVAQPDIVESLSVPAQQIARMLVDDVTMTEAEKTAIEDVIDTTYIRELYAADYADNIKELIRAGHPEVISANKAKYLGLWAGLVAKHPIEAIKAWYDLIGGYIYPDFAYEVGNIDGVIGNDCGLYWNPLIGGKFVKIKEIFIKLGSFVPLYGLLWSIGSYSWLLVISLFAAIWKKKEYLTRVLLVMMFATLLIAAPVVDFRYGYGYVTTMPLWITILWEKRTQDEAIY